MNSERCGYCPILPKNEQDLQECELDGWPISAFEATADFFKSKKHSCENFLSAYKKAWSLAENQEAEKLIEQERRRAVQFDIDYNEFMAEREAEHLSDLAYKSLQHWQLKYKGELNTKKWNKFRQMHLSPIGITHELQVDDKVLLRETVKALIPHIINRENGKI